MGLGLELRELLGCGEKRCRNILGSVGTWGQMELGGATVVGQICGYVTGGAHRFCAFPLFFCFCFFCLFPQDKLEE